MKSLIIIFGTFIYLIGLPLMFASIDDLVTQDIDQSFALVNTGAAATAQNVTLSQAVHKNSVAFINTVTSNLSQDTPTGASYNSVNKALEISGLSPSLNRTILVSFSIASSTLPAQANLFLDTLVRWFLIFAGIGMMGGAVYAFFTS